MEYSWYQRALRDFAHSDKWVRGVFAGQGALISKTKRDWRIENTPEGVIRYILYNTPVLSFYPDGAVILCTDGWDTQTTKEFMQTYIPHGVYFNRRQLDNVTQRKEFMRTYIPHGVYLNREQLGYVTQSFVTIPDTGERSGFHNLMRLVPYGDTLRVESPLPTKERVMDKEATQEAMDEDEDMKIFMEAFNMLAMSAKLHLAENKPSRHFTGAKDVISLVRTGDLKGACNCALWAQLYNDYSWPHNPVGGEPVNIFRARRNVYAAWKRSHAKYNIIDVPPVPPTLGV